MSKQPCFVCEGDGQVYPFAGKKGMGAKTRSSGMTSGLKAKGADEYKIVDS